MSIRRIPNMLGLDAGKEGISKALIQIGIGDKTRVGIWVSAMISVRAIPTGMCSGMVRAF
jgi:hypothetical protein